MEGLYPTGREFLPTRPPKKRILGTVIYCLVACLLLFGIIVNFVIRVEYFGVIVSGQSMEHTLQSGDFLYARKAEKQPFQRGDVVIVNVTKYKSQFGLSGDFIIKRVIATEGDTVYAQAGVVFLKKSGEENFSPLNEPYAYGFTDNFPAVTVRGGEFFFMGDNRRNSFDARHIGCLLNTDVEGVVSQWVIDNRPLVRNYYLFTGGSLSA